MNTQQAKFILQAYRPGGQDANDPQFAEALEQVKNDPKLAEWFAAQTAFDDAVARALGTVAPPAQLREMILAGRRVIEPAPWWKRPVWWAMAASIVVLFGLALWFRGENSARFADYRQKMMAAHKNSVGHVEFENGDPAKMQLWLANHGAETNFALPAALRGKAGGCRVLDWHGRKVSMVCYMLDQTNHFDVFVARTGNFWHAAFPKKPELIQNGPMTIAGWSRDGWTYLVIGEGDKAHLREFVETKDLAEGSIEGTRSAGMDAAQFPRSPAAPPRSRNFFSTYLEYVLKSRLER